MSWYFSALNSKKHQEESWAATETAKSIREEIHGMVSGNLKKYFSTEVEPLSMIDDVEP